MDCRMKLVIDFQLALWCGEGASVRGLYGHPAVLSAQQLLSPSLYPSFSLSLLTFSLEHLPFTSHPGLAGSIEDGVVSHWYTGLIW